ncbi:MAG: VWA domain-containing protein [Nanoarchaeota archaeon]|nr:VWA domain-containing protein [Nanoarchaeota archaeon]
MEITFARPLYLVLLISVPFLVVTHFFTYIHVKKRAMRFANFDAIKRVTGGDKRIIANTVFISRNVTVLILRTIILLFLILSASGPVIWFTGRATESAFVIAIDTSSSMLADDLAPNRLIAAKESASDFVNLLHSRTSIGVLAFSGASFIKTGLTDDLSLVKRELSTVEASRVGGTDLGGAIVDSINMMEEAESAKSVIVLTDGRGNVGTDPDEAVSYANEKRVRIHTIGVGTKEGGAFMKTLAVTKLDEDILRQIATDTLGTYHSAGNQAELEMAFTDIAASEEDKLPLRLSMGLMLLALVLIFLEWGLINTKYRTVP